MDYENQDTKTCSLCNETLRVEEFGWKNSSKKLRQARCKACSKKYAKGYYQANKNQLQQKARETYSADKPKAIKRNKSYVARLKNTNPEKLREWGRKGNRKQRKLPTPTRPCPDHCEMCGKHFSERRNAFHLDHCHETGMFRGWLCSLCNTAFGALGDNFQEAFLRLTRYKNLIEGDK